MTTAAAARALPPILAACLAAGCLVPPDVPPPSPLLPTSLALSAGAWDSGNLSVAVVSAVNASWISPSNLTFNIVDSAGTVYYLGHAGATFTGTNGTVRVHYEDTTDPGAVSAGDSILISVSPPDSSAVSGGSLTVVAGVKRLASVALP